MSSAAGAGYARPFRVVLIRLIVLCMLPLFLLAAWLAFDSISVLRAEHRETADQSVKNFVVLVDHHLSSRIRGLRMLAVSPLVDDASRWPELYREAQGFRESFGSHVVLADIGEPMQMLFNTRVPLGTKLPPLPRPRGHAAAPTALETGQPAVGDRFIGPVAKEPLVAIAVPAVRDGQVTHLLLSIFETTQFQARLDEFSLPPGWAMTLLDGNGSVIAHRGPPGLDSARDVDPASRFTVNSDVSPWSVMLEIPRSVEQAPLQTTIVLLVLGLLATTLTGVLAGAAASRRLGLAVASLSKSTASGPVLPEIAEIAAARRELDTSATLLSASEARFQRLFDAAPLAMALASHDGRILTRNERFNQLIGYAEDDVRSLAEWWPLMYPDPAYRAEVRASWYAEVARAASMGGRVEASGIRITHKDGTERIVDIVGISLPEGLLTVFLDITERTQAEKALANAQALALERQRLGRLAAVNQMEDANAARARAEEAEGEVRRLNADLERRVLERTAELSASNRELDSFAYAVSHDLRAPLRAMSGFSQALMEDYGDRLDGEARVYLNQIVSASRKMDALIDGILILSRITRGEPRCDWIDLSALAARRLAELARDEPARRVRVEIEPGLCASGDQRMIEVVMTNLIDNAWKYTGKVASPAIRVHAGEVRGQAGVCVTDNGAGFDMAHAERLFKPFQRLHRQDEFPGIGVGLATVQRIIHRHHGEIVAEAAPGAGATFCFTLPMAPPERPPETGIEP